MSSVVKSTYIDSLFDARHIKG